MAYHNRTLVKLQSSLRRWRAPIPLALAALAIAFLVSCDPRPTVDTTTVPDLEVVKKEKTIKAGWAPYPPYALKNSSSGKVEGFYIELFEKASSEAGLLVEFVETTWSTMVSDLKSKRFQVMAAPVFRTIPRALEVSFTRPVDYFGLSALVRSGDRRFTQLQDFDKANVRVATVEGEVGWDFARLHLRKAQILTHKSGNISVALLDVIEGKADVGITDAWTIKQFAAAHPGRVTDLFGSRPFGLVGSGWFVRQNSVELLQFLDTSIDWLESSGTLREVASKYDLPSISAPAGVH
jgi:cyclohexadienyl dehydratase